MRFANPRMLWLFWVTLPLLSWFLWWAWRKKQALIRQFVQSRLLAHLTVGVSARIQKARLVLLVLATSLAMLALARPQWGFTWEEAKQRGLDIVVAIDTSRSMLAADLQPNRIERAKLAALDLMRLAKSDRLGLVAFAGTAFLQCPLTLDEEAFRQSVNAVEVGIIPQGGTALAEAIETAARAFKDEGDNHKVIVLFTDGEDHERGGLEAAQKAAEAGVRIFTVGVGTANGELLRQRDEKGALNYIKDDLGNVVKSRLDESILTEIATAAKGFYLPMSGAQTVDILYERGLADLPKSEISSKLVKRYREQYHWLLVLAIFLLVLETLLPDRKLVARTGAMAASSANAELRKAVALVCLCLFAANADASPGSALRKYEAGRFKEAGQEYERLLEKKPDDPKLHYNAGTAAYQAGEFEKAAKHFAAAIAAPDLALQRLAYYNLGNALARLGQNQGEVPKKAEAWEESAKQYESALKLNPQDTDARFNLDLIKEWLAMLPKPPPTPKPDDSKEKDEKKDQDKQDPQSGQSKESKPKDEPEKKDQKEQEQNQANQKSEEEKKQEQKKQEQSKSDQNKEEKAQAKDKPAPQSGEKPDKGSTETANAAAAKGQLTQEQVQRLLDAQKGDEKAMIFVPQEKKSGKARVFKDW